MISKAQLKADIDTLDDSCLDVLHRILAVLKTSQPESACSSVSPVNPLKGSVLFETDLLSPIDESWDAER